MAFSQTPYSSVAEEALAERAEMQYLNQKLAEYIDKVRALRNSIGLNPRDYNEALRQLELEVLKLKDLYDKELDKLRGKLKDAYRQCRALELDRDKQKEFMKDLMERANLAKTLADENARLKKMLESAEKLIADLNDKLRSLQPELEAGKKYRKMNDDLKKQFFAEVKKKQDAEAAEKSALDKGEFDRNSKDQRIKELEERVRTMADVIAGLERRLKELSKGDASLPATLARIRAANEEEMKKYQRDSENALRRGIEPLKDKIKDDKCKRDKMERDIRALEDSLRDLVAKNNVLQGKIGGLEREREALIKQNQADRAKADQTVHELEQRIHQLMDQIMSNSKEFVNARDAQSSLRDEIDVYRALLQSEGYGTEQTRESNRARMPKVIAKTSESPSLPNLKKHTYQHAYSFKGPSYQSQA